MAARSLLNPDLAGWRMAGPGGFRRTSEGAIESFGGSGLFWYADAMFGDFVLSVEWRIAHPDDNSGVFLRCPPLDDDVHPAIEHGYEVQIDDRGFDPETGTAGSPLHMTGAIYKLAPALRRNWKPVGAWNAFEIRALGTSIAVRLNGLHVVHLPNAQRRTVGHIALQNHHAGSAVRFRNLKIALP